MHSIRSVITSALGPLCLPAQKLKSVSKETVTITLKHSIAHVGDCYRGRIIGELFLESYFKASYFGELFLCKLDDLM